MSQLRDRMGFLAWVFGKMKIRETQGANKGEVVNWILRRAEGKPGQPWCVAFIDGIYELSCESLGIKPKINPSLSCSALYSKAKKLGMIFTDCREAKKGDFIILRGGSTGHQHIGMVWVVEGNHILTVEGNTNFAGSSEGDGVYWKKRPIKPDLYDFVRID
jgi:hypothetical protein